MTYLLKLPLEIYVFTQLFPELYRNQRINWDKWTTGQLLCNFCQGTTSLSLSFPCCTRRNACSRTTTSGVLTMTVPLRFPCASHMYQKCTVILQYINVYVVKYIYINVYLYIIKLYIQFSCSVVSNSLWPHGPQYARLPYPSPTPRACSNSGPSNWWCHPTISSSVSPFSPSLQSFPASGSFPMSQFFASGGQNIGASASASVFPINI